MREKAISWLAKRLVA